jgi:hypothetical protein
LQNQVSIEEDLEKIEKLSMINANARFELLTANQQLLDFQLNRFIKFDQKKKRRLGNEGNSMGRNDVVRSGNRSNDLETSRR